MKDLFNFTNLNYVIYNFQSPTTESFKITRTENQNFLEDGKVELESTVSLTLQHKSIVQDIRTGAESVAPPLTSSGVETPPAVSSIRFHDNINSNEKDHNGFSSGEASSNFPAPPSPTEVSNLFCSTIL